MKWIKYQIVCGKNENGEDILLNKKIGYSNENLAIAEVEAYNGYQIIEDSQSFDKEPLDIKFGGTNAANVRDAKKNLGILYSEEIPTEPPTTGEGTICFVKSDGTPTPIEEGGTGATTVRGVHENLGVHDYIVEQGKSGNWYYRKCNSGVAELWGAFAQDVTAYSKNGFVVGSNAITKYPFAITEPIAQATGRKIGTGAGYITYDYERVDYWSGIMNAPADQGIVAGTTMNVAYYVHVFAKWK